MRTTADQNDSDAFPGDDPTLVVDDSGGDPELAAAELRRRLGLPEGECIRDYGELRTIGIGGMGTVFSGKEPGLKCPVALKLLRSAYRSIPERVSAFIREARVTAQIGHPNIVPVHRIGVFENAGIYYSMKLVQGRTLRSILNSLAEGDPETRRRFTLRRLLEIFVSACNGVSFAHHRGVLHCDLKPANLMVGDYGEVLVMDWGMAQCREPDSAEGRRVDLGGEAASDPPERMGGTPAFMAPELLTAKPLPPDEQTDVYSLGAILYTILTWRASPFPHELPAERVAAAAAAGKFVPPRRAADPAQDVPRELEAITLKAMARDRRKRYRTVAELLEELRNYMDGYPVSAYSPNPLYRFFKLIYRRPAIPAVGAAALLTWFGFTALRDIQDRAEAESLFNLAGYNYLEGQSADRALRRDYRMAVIPRLAESEAGDRLREEIDRQRFRMTDNYTAALELLGRVPEKILRQEPRVNEMCCEIFRRMLSNRLMSRDRRWIEDTIVLFRVRWPERFAAAVRSDRELRRIVDMIDADLGVLEIECESSDWHVVLRSAADPAAAARRFEVSAGKRPRLELPSGNYELEFAREGRRSVFVPVRVDPVLATRLCFEPPKHPVDRFRFVTAREEMDPGGNLYVGGGFQMAENEVTLREFRDFWLTLPVAERRRRIPRIGSGDTAFPAWDGDGNVAPGLSPDLPVTGVSGDAAESYCAYLSAKLGRKVRLPREWEWRRAARGADRRRYPWGAEYRRECALLADSVRVKEFPHGAPGGSFPGDRSPFGICGMAGNVREYAVSSTGESTLLPVLGGSYMIPPQYASIDAVQFRSRNDGGADIGFRCLIEE